MRITEIENKIKYCNVFFVVLSRKIQGEINGFKKSEFKKEIALAANEKKWMFCDFKMSEFESIP